jgi:hypothetical protein
LLLSPQPHPPEEATEETKGESVFNPAPPPWLGLAVPVRRRDILSLPKLPAATAGRACSLSPGRDSPKVAGGATPGLNVPIIRAPEGRRKPAHQRYRSSYPTPLFFNIATYSSWNVRMR